MHSSVLSILLLAATATLTLASPSTSSHHSVSRRNGPLAKQRLHSRANSLKRSSPSSASAPSTRRTRSRRSAVPMVESLEERDMSERRHVHAEDKRGLLDGVLSGAGGSSSSSSASPVGGLPSVPGSSVLGLVKLQNLLNSGSSKMNTHQNNIAKLAKQARTYDKSSRSGSKFQNSVYQELKAYRGSAESLPGLKELDDATKGAAGDHGLDNFNRDDPVQVLVRTLNESTQQTLESINLIVYYVPVLGPLLGPIVYDIKCILDNILNAGQINIDGLLNNLDLGGLKLLSSDYASSMCKMSPSLAAC
ncbi:hypothetical protein JCM16303_002011 [Sporobolomyces ruberrimus]